MKNYTTEGFLAKVSKLSQEREATVLRLRSIDQQIAQLMAGKEARQTNGTATRTRRIRKTRKPNGETMEQVQQAFAQHSTLTFQQLKRVTNGIGDSTLYHALGTLKKFGRLTAGKAPNPRGGKAPVAVYTWKPQAQPTAQESTVEPIAELATV